MRTALLAILGPDQLHDQVLLSSVLACGQRRTTCALRPPAAQYLCCGYHQARVPTEKSIATPVSPSGNYPPLLATTKQRTLLHGSPVSVITEGPHLALWLAPRGPLGGLLQLVGLVSSCEVGTSLPERGPTPPRWEVLLSGWGTHLALQSKR